MSVLLWMWLLGTLAWATNYSVTLCIEYQVDFVDAASGDHWTNNGDIVAHGLEIAIVDDSGSHTHTLGVTGCTTETVVLGSASDTFTLKARNRASVNGVNMRTFDTEYYNQQPNINVVWHGLSPLVAHIKEMPLEQMWYNLAVGKHAFALSDYHIHDPPSRGCCIDSSSQADGTCSSPHLAEHEYEVVDTPVLFFAHDNLGCGQSSVKDQLDEEYVAVGVDDDCAYKYTIAHELGHVISEMRMGAKEFGMYPGDAPDDGCQGDVSTAPLDPRGRMSKEYMAIAFREGWGDFLSTFLWNNPNETDCVYATMDYYMDFDLDGDVDNDYTSTDPYNDRESDCIGSPWMHSYLSGIDGEDWLEDVEDFTDIYDCEAASSHEDNRSTVHDVAVMLWVLLTEEDIPVETLVDLYVDMCPRQWEPYDASADPDERPLARLGLSADANGIATEVSAASALHIEH